MDNETLDTLTEDERRLELQAVEEARDDVRAGRIVSARAVRRWVSRLGTASEMPPPRSL